MNSKLSWGKQISDGKLVHVSKAIRGIDCECVCPHCGTKLIAKKGQINCWHFAHEIETSCNFNNESALHLYAKELFQTKKELTIPQIRYFDGLEDININYCDIYKTNIADCYDISKCIVNSKTINIDDIELEKSISYKNSFICPDILVTSGKAKLAIEILVSHEVNEEKRDKYRDLGLSVIEINLAEFNLNCDIDPIENVLLKNSEKKYWIYNNFANKAINKNYKKVIYRGKNFSRNFYICPKTKKYHKKLCSHCQYSAYYYEGSNFAYNLCSYPKESSSRF